jgi:hypothetical protein
VKNVGTQQGSGTDEPFAPRDVDRQHDLWGANCGPAALAALLEMSVADVRGLVERKGPFKGYMNAGDLVSALRHLGLATSRSDHPRGRTAWPLSVGLAVIQIEGPWCAEEVNPRARFRYTHIVASRHGGSLVYDVNAKAWLDRSPWEQYVMKPIVAAQSRATGWYTSTTIEVGGLPRTIATIPTPAAAQLCSICDGPGAGICDTCIVPLKQEVAEAIADKAHSVMSIPDDRPDGCLRQMCWLLEWERGKVLAAALRRVGLKGMVRRRGVNSADYAVDLQVTPPATACFRCDDALGLIAALLELQPGDATKAVKLLGGP